VPIPRPEESYRVCMCFTECDQVQQHPTKPAMNWQRGQIEQKRKRDFRVVRSLLAHVRTAVHRYVGKGGKIRNMSRLSRLFTDLWAGCDDGCSRPASTLRAVLSCGGCRDSASRFRYVSSTLGFICFCFVWFPVLGRIFSENGGWVFMGPKLRGQTQGRGCCPTSNLYGVDLV
jgi:hypothetical protein